MKKLLRVSLVMCLVLSMVFIPLKAKAANERDVFCWIEKGESLNVTYAKGTSFEIYNDKKIVSVKKNKTKFTVKGLKVGSTEVDIKDSKKKIIGTIHVTVVKSGRKAITNATATVGVSSSSSSGNSIKASGKNVSLTLLSSDKISSSNKDIVEASIEWGDLLLYPKKEGKATVTVKSKDGKVVYKIKITCKVMTSDVEMRIGDTTSISCSSYKIVSGDSVSLKQEKGKGYSYVDISAEKTGVTKVGFYNASRNLMFYENINVIEAESIDESILDEELLLD